MQQVSSLAAFLEIRMLNVSVNLIKNSKINVYICNRQMQLMCFINPLKTNYFAHSNNIFVNNSDFMRSFFEKLKLRFLVLATFLSTVFGGVVTYLRTCGTQTAIVTTQIVSNPANQIAATEAASFVANLFYEGADDPFPTAGMGGEMGKTLKPVVLKKGEMLFVKALNKIVGKYDFIKKTSQDCASPQIQQGARAIQKKVGHAESEGYATAFSDIKFNQKEAEKLIYNIISESDVIVIRPFLTKIYNNKGQGISILTQDGTFRGFVERTMENELKK